MVFLKKTMKIFSLFIIIYFAFASCVPQKRNIYQITGTDYGFKPPQEFIGILCDSLNYKVIDKIIQKFGDKYSFEKDSFEEKYFWSKIIFPVFNNQPLDIIVHRQMIRLTFKDNKIHKLESITLSIRKNNHDFLYPLKFRHRRIVKRFLVDLIE